MSKKSHECSSVCPNFSKCKVRLGLLDDAIIESGHHELNPRLDNRLPAIPTRLSPPLLTLVSA